MECCKILSCLHYKFYFSKARFVFIENHLLIFLGVACLQIIHFGDCQLMMFQNVTMVQNLQISDLPKDALMIYQHLVVWVITALIQVRTTLIAYISFAHNQRLALNMIRHVMEFATVNIVRMNTLRDYVN